MTVHYIEYHGKKISLRKWCALWNVSYNSALSRKKRGVRGKWKLLGFDGPRPFPVTPEERTWLRETYFARKGQEAKSQKYKARDSEWDIACDLIGMPRIFADELREAMDGRKAP